MNAKRLFFVMLSILLLAVAGSGWLYLQTKQQLQTSVDAIAGKKAEIERVEEDITQLQQLQQEVDAYEDQDVNLSVFLPTAKNQSEALDTLFTTFNNVGVNIESFNFTPTKGIPNPTSQSDKNSDTNVYDLPVTISPTSEQSISYSRFMQLLVALENSQRHLSIDSLSITASQDEETGSNTLNIGLSISMHYVE